MYNFKNYLQDLSENSGIIFDLIGEDGTIYFGNNSSDRGNSISLRVKLGKSKADVILDKKYELCIPILKYSIENKYKELFSLREQSLIDILEGKEVGITGLDRNLPFIPNGCVLFLVNVDGSKYEALNIIKQLYNEQDIVSIIYGDNIIILGKFEEIIEHANSIKESIVSDLYCKCYVSFSEVAYSAEGIKKAYEDAKECMVLGKKFGIKGEIYDYNNMIFEKLVYNINERVKTELFEEFKEKFGVFDNEMINTIEEFVSSGLNISDASRKLYIHRNTLIYRLDKINKDTGYDIRNFKQATIFIIAFLVWKEKR
ncbi:helix-turn-helix domain-containing protein [Clostridium sp. 19966]|uniref:PucR family transcriptional regulator n=1 Tax=Clostridium sp. 19966 TaxID=2768166 RepID=UPI0028DF9B1A|nr:helix-turn-helix domain-containing protein [Clostridium sp. 19966]MDT8716739.1 helix-turn-helix domain-containing protein [Clostridium sp. 19966]